AVDRPAAVRLAADCPRAQRHARGMGIVLPAVGPAGNDTATGLRRRGTAMAHPAEPRGAVAYDGGGRLPRRPRLPRRDPVAGQIAEGHGTATLGVKRITG